MADIKTKPTEVKVEDFLNAVEPEWRREDAFVVMRLMEKITGEKGKMWGSSIVGFGEYHYKYESGREGDMCIAGFSPRKPEMVIYLLFDKENKDLLEKLGKCRTTVTCLYVKKLSDIDINVLEQMIKNSVEGVKKKYR